jgi:hypothetical protein
MNSKYMDVRDLTHDELLALYVQLQAAYIEQMERHRDDMRVVTEWITAQANSVPIKTARKTAPATADMWAQLRTK